VRQLDEDDWTHRERDDRDHARVLCASRDDDLTFGAAGRGEQRRCG